MVRPEHPMRRAVAAALLACCLCQGAAGAAADVGGGGATSVWVELRAPRWVARGGEATLTCLHQVPAQLLYKVEFVRTGGKLLQYVRERDPPYINYTVPGARLNMSLSSASSVTLQNMEFAASAMYWCEVSLDTPIFTAASSAHTLTVIHPQKHPPIITFGSPEVAVGGVLRANCTSAPASPPPHLTWYIDGIKVENASVRHYSYRVASSYRSAGRWRKTHRHLVRDGNRVGDRASGTTAVDVVRTTSKGYVKCSLKDTPPEEVRAPSPRAPPPAPTPAPLTVTVSELRAPAHAKLQLACIATIPHQVAPGEHFADMKKQTVTVDVNELLPKKRSPEASQSSADSVHKICLQLAPVVAALIFIYFNKGQH